MVSQLFSTFFIQTNIIIWPYSRILFDKKINRGRNLLEEGATLDHSDSFMTISEKLNNYHDYLTIDDIAIDEILTRHQVDVDKKKK